MKLIIDIDENTREYLYDIARGRILPLGDKLSYELQAELVKAIVDSIPLDNIRNEIKEWYWQADKQALAKDPCVVDAMVDLFIRTIDKHIGKRSKDEDSN